MVHGIHRKLVLAAWIVCFTVCGEHANAQGKPATLRSGNESRRIAVPNAVVNEQFAWNRDDMYVPPDFEGYFSKDDTVAVKRLDAFMADQKLRDRSPNGKTRKT